MLACLHVLHAVCSRRSTACVLGPTRSHSLMLLVRQTMDSSKSNLAHHHQPPQQQEQQYQGPSCRFSLDLRSLRFWT